MDELVSSTSFNIFDIFVRIIPGCVLTSFLRILWLNSSNFGSTIAEDILLYVAISYALGALIDIISKPVSYLINTLLFGGNPRKQYMFKAKKHWNIDVIRDKHTRDLANTQINHIFNRIFPDPKKDKLPSDRTSEDEGKKDGSLLERTSENEEKGDFAFGYMINYLESHGNNEKEDRLLSIANMGISMATTIALCFICTLLTPAPTILEQYNVIVIALLAFGSFVGFISLYLVYIRMRFSVVVRTFSVIFTK